VADGLAASGYSPAKEGKIGGLQAESNLEPFNL